MPRAIPATARGLALHEAVGIARNSQPKRFTTRSNPSDAGPEPPSEAQSGGPVGSAIRNDSSGPGSPASPASSARPAPSSGSPAPSAPSLSAALFAPPGRRSPASVSPASLSPARPLPLSPPIQTVRQIMSRLLQLLHAPDNLDSYQERQQPSHAFFPSFAGMAGAEASRRPDRRNSPRA